MEHRQNLISRRLVLCCFLLLSFSVQPRSSDRLLLKIDKSKNLERSADAAGDVILIQELDSCWIAKASAEQFLALSEMGIACEILDPAPEGKAHYLLIGSSHGEMQVIEPFGHLVALENEIWLYWSDGEAFWDLLPAQIQVKLLPETTPLRIVGSAAGLNQGMLAQELIRPHPRVAQMAGEVSKNNLYAGIQNLQDFQTRRATTTSLEAAGAAIYAAFRAQGVAAEYDTFTFSYQGASYTTNNIVATIPGKTAPEQIVIVGAHYDSTSNDPLVLAPGADDNASGSAAVMEIARIMNHYSFDRTVRFICFSAEELGLLGSRHYAQEAVRAGENIRGMIDLDMIAYTAKAAEDLDIITNSSSEWLADLFLACAGNYTALPILKSIRPSATGSDHSPFWDQGYSAVMGIEAYPLANPCYHRTTDTLDKLNIDFAAAVTQAALATAATLAQPVSTPSIPTDVAARSTITRSLFSRLKTVLLSWKSADPTVVGFNVYRSADLGTSYRKINSALVTTHEYIDRYLTPAKAYLYIITAVDGQGRESFDSVEVRND
jgi:hypothetical protein